MTYEAVRETDPAVADALRGERERQNDTLAMIASENHVSEAVLEAQSDVVDAPNDTTVLERVSARVDELTDANPLYE